MTAIGNAAGEQLSAQVTVYNPSGTAVEQAIEYDVTVAKQNGVTARGYGHTFYQTAEAIDALQFLMSSGNISSGTVDLYGVRNP